MHSSRHCLSNSIFFLRFSTLFVCLSTFFVLISVSMNVGTKSGTHNLSAEAITVLMNISLLVVALAIVSACLYTG